jgi:hypothetical protein
VRRQELELRGLVLDTPAQGLRSGIPRPGREFAEFEKQKDRGKFKFTEFIRRAPAIRRVCFQSEGGPVWDRTCTSI